MIEIKLSTEGISRVCGLILVELKRYTQPKAEGAELDAWLKMQNLLYDRDWKFDVMSSILSFRTKEQALAFVLSFPEYCV